MEKSFRKYVILWLSQGISGLGSSMTGFVLVLWAYGESRSAMSVSLMSFCNYVPYVILSLLAGSFIDIYSKKTIMLVSDSVAALGSLAVVAGLIVPEEKISNVSGLNSFSNNLIVVFSPMLAAFLFAAGGLWLILLIDLISKISQMLYNSSILKEIRIFFLWYGEYRGKEGLCRKRHQIMTTCLRR